MTEWNSRIWYQIFICPECGKKSTVTNVCRQCPKTPADALLTMPIYCSVHEVAHYKDGKPVSHRSLNMVETEWASRFNSILERDERKKVKNLPEDAILK